MGAPFQWNILGTARVMVFRVGGEGNEAAGQIGEEPQTPITGGLTSYIITTLLLQDV